jgi:hypothetical protein
MSDVSVSLGVTGKDAVLGAFSEVGAAGQKMGETFGSIAGKLAGLAAGYVSVSGAIHAFNSVMEKGGQLADFSDQTGIAAGKLVILQRAFENNGMHAEDLGGIINKMQKTLVAAGDEGSAAADKLGRLGLKVSDLQSMTPDQQFETIAKAIAKIQDPTERAGAAMEIFGKSGGKTLALFADFEGQVSQASSEVGSFASEMENNARAFDSIGDGIGAIGQKLTEFTAGLLGDSIPAMTTLVDYFKSVDATAFGKSFSEALSTGIDIALSVFTNPGNLFLAFGDSLVLAFKTAGNALYSALQYVFEWSTNYFSNIIPNWSGLLKAEFTAAFGFVVSGFSGMLAEVFTGIAGYLPEKLGGPMAEIGNKLAKTSDEWSNKAAVGLAEAWDGISSAAEKATEQTKMANEDWFNAAGSAADLKDHLQVAQDAGAGVRNAMQESVDHAKQITAEATAWEKATNQMADNFSGAADSFKKFTQRDTEAAGLAAQSGLIIPQGDIGPVAGDGDIRSAAAANRAARESVLTGKSNGRSLTPEQAMAEAMKTLLRPEDYVQATTGNRSSWDQIQQRMETRASQSVQSDLSSYTGGDSRASRQQSIDDLFSKYVKEGVSGSRAELRKRAEDDFNKLVNDKLKNAKGEGPGGTGPGSEGKAKKSPQEEQSNSLSEILKFVRTICNDKLPVYALS